MNSMAYKVVLEEKEPNRILCLAVPEDIYEDFFYSAFSSNISKPNGTKIANI